jgi:hypothetical protein
LKIGVKTELISDQQQEQEKARRMKVIKGIDLLLNLFEKARQQRQKLFPRKIMTAKCSGQIIVKSKEEILQKFEDADFIDCRINAYPVVPAGTLQAPNIIMIDLDMDRSLNTGSRLVKKDLHKTLQKIEEYSDGAIVPLVIWTGNGYHVYIVLNLGEPLEYIVEYSNLDVTKEISKEFIRFAKSYLSDNKADSKNNPSFESCLLRVPYTLNSKCLYAKMSEEESEVKVIQNWNNHAANINEIALLLSGFYTHLVNTKNERDKNTTKEIKRNFGSNTSNSIPWIETLLQITLLDHRKYVISLILAPYLINIKQLSEEAAIAKIKEWLSRCDKVKKLDSTYNFDYRINYCINKCKTNRNLKPIRFEGKLQKSNLELYRIIKSKL